MKKKPVPPIDRNISDNTTSTRRVEKDTDDLVHSRAREIPKDQNNEDPDDRVHQSTGLKPRQENDENIPQDPDDLIHDNDDDEDE